MNDKTKLKNVVCKNCNSKDRVIEVQGDHPSIYCIHCDYINFPAEHYNLTVEQYENSEKYNEYYIDTPPFLWYHRKAINHLKQNLAAARILDFGCYDGFFTRKLVDSGFDAYGSDWNKRSMNRGIDQYRLQGRLSSNPIGKFDCIVALEVIEHFPDPNEFMRIINTHLDEEGYLILSCPNKNAIYRPNTDSPPHHFSRFSVTALNILLNRYGFEVIKSELEMSSFQLMRNYIGDRIRSKPMLLEADGTDGINSPYIKFLKKIANRISKPLELCFKPLDMILRYHRIYYISQFIVAKKITC